MRQLGDPRLHRGTCTLGLGALAVVVAGVLLATTALWASDGVTVTGITPSSGNNNQSSLSITNLAGTDFSTGSNTVKLQMSGQTDITATSVVGASTTKITCKFNLVGAKAGAWDVYVSNTNGSATLTGGFTINDVAPTVTSITPSIGDNTTSASVSIGGTNFASNDTVQLQMSGQTPITATGVTATSSTKITCTCPITGAALGAWDVVVTDTSGGTGKLAGGFTILGAPTVTSITPSSGYNTGNVSVTNLAGTNFGAGDTVALQMTGQTPIAATSVTAVSSTKITCTLPIIGAADGAWDVVVTDPYGVSATLPGGFTVSYPPAPTVTGISPTTGAAGSVVNATVTGTNFMAGDYVSLRMTGQFDVSGNSVTIVSSTEITCSFTLPSSGPGVIGLWDVIVGDSLAQEGKLPQGFTITLPAAPTVTSISQTTGVQGGYYYPVTITGTNFVNTDTLVLRKAGQTDIAFGSESRDSSTQFTASLSIPSTGALSGYWDLVITDLYGQTGALAKAFLIPLPAPTVTGITPSAGTNDGPVSITNLAGTNFYAGDVVTLQKSGQPNITAASVNVVSTTQITCTFDLTGAAVGAWDVVVTDTTGGSGKLAGGFTVGYPGPTVTGITPSSGLNNGPVSITNLAGTYFRSGATVALKMTGQTDIPGTSVNVVSATKITCTFDLTGAAVGAWDVVVTNTDSQSGTLSGGFTIGYPAPTVTGIAPSSGLNSGPVNITNLAGTYFRSGATVALKMTGQANIPGTSVNVVSPTQITCTFDLTGKLTGPWDVVVTNTDSKSGTLPAGFAVDTPFTVLTYTGDTSVDILATLHLKAVLTGWGAVPLPNKTVQFAWSGSNVTAVTDANGLATYNYTGAKAPGTYSLAISFAGDAYDPACKAYASFNVTNSQSGVTGQGKISYGPSNANQATFTVAVADSATPSGTWTVQDLGRRQTVVSTSVATLTFNGAHTQATITGNCTVNGVPTTYTLIVAHPGHGSPDTLSLTAGAYSVSGNAIQGGFVFQ